MRRLIATVLVSFAACLASSLARAQDLGSEHIRITLDTKKSRKAAKDKKQKDAYTRAWRNACDSLGNALLVSKGPWGFGAFQSFGCYRGKKRLSGTDKTGRWSLSVVESDGELSFRVDMTQPGGDKLEVAQVKLAGSEASLQFFRDHEFTDLVAYALLDRLPMGMQVVRANVKGSPPSFKGRHARAGNAKAFKYRLPPPPENLVLYRLAWDPSAKIWRSNVAGSAKMTKLVPPKKKTRDKKTRLEGGTVTYETSDEITQALAEGPLWAQNAAGPGARAAEMDDALGDAQKTLQTAHENGKLEDLLSGKIDSLVDSLLETAASGYVGLRYGMQVLAGDPLLSKTRMFSLLAEIRGGPLEGLRYYYDKLPTTTATQDGFETSIEWSRHVLGFSIGFDVPLVIIDRITADPKIGLWNFKADLPLQGADGKVSAVRSFELGRTFSVALEIGLENVSSWYTLRGWYAIDTGFSLLKQGGRVTSNRFGTDAYFTPFEAFPIFGHPFKAALMGFFVYESVELQSGDADVAAGDETITGVSYDGGYAGGGIAISW